MKRLLQEAFWGAAALIVIAGPSAAETISPRRLVEVADLAAPVISPDGRSVAFRLEQASIERNTYDTVWYVQATYGEAPPRRVADGGVTLRGSAGVTLPPPIVWSPDGRWIYYRALIDGRIDIWRAAADGSGAEPVTLDPADARDFSLSDDGGTLFYSVGAPREAVIAAEQAEYDRGVRIDKTVPLGQPLFRSGNVEGRLATQRFGGIWFDRASLLADVPDRWRSINLATGERRDLAVPGLPPDRPAFSDFAQGLPAPWKYQFDTGRTRVALLTRTGEAQDFREPPALELAMLSNSAPVPTVCLAEQCASNAMTGIQWRPNSDEVIFTVTAPQEGLAQSIHRWNVETGEVRLVIRSRGLLGGGRSPSSACGLSAEMLVCVTAEPDRPPRLERVDLDTGRRQVLFDPNAGLARDMTDTAPARLLRWSNEQGQEFTGQFFSAGKPGETPAPLFVTYYSCTGFLRGGVGDEWPLATLAERGISALCINDPPGYLADAVARYGRGLSGVQSVVELLASEGEIDREKVGMGGLSFGSELTYWTVMNSDLPVAASVSSTALSPSYYLFGSLREDAFLSGLNGLWQLGEPSETPERWQALSPAYNLGKIRTPVLMQMSEQEYMHSLDYAIPLIREYRADLYVFPHEPHQKFQPRHKLAVYERNLDWFRFWLQDYEDPDPRKAEQYRHWREMRAARDAATSQ